MELYTPYLEKLFIGVITYSTHLYTNLFSAIYKVVHNSIYSNDPREATLVTSVHITRPGKLTVACPLDDDDSLRWVHRAQSQARSEVEAEGYPPRKH